MCRILALTCTLQSLTVCELCKKAASTVTSAKHPFKYSNNHPIVFLVLLGWLLQPMLILLLLNSLQVAKAAKDAKKKNLKVQFGVR